MEPERIRQALDAGITLLGENYVQEAREKIPAIGHVAEWHMIGHLQTNKVKYVVNLFDWIHSVDRLELARELDKRAGQNNRRLNVLIEVNVSGEESKSGIEADTGVGTCPTGIPITQSKPARIDDHAALFR